VRMVDAIVVGGGPAGSTTALELARAGVAVALIDRSTFEAPRFGEHLPPGAKPLLRHLGVWDAFAAADHLPTPGVVSIWGNARPYNNDFFASPYGHGWHLDRTRFDSMLLDSAERAGAHVFRPARIRVRAKRSEHGWLVEYSLGGTKREIAASYLIDATGRSASLSRRLGARRIVRDQLVGVIGFGICADGADPRTILEAVSDGWWYAAQLPNGRFVAAYMTDSDLLPRGHDLRKQYWKDRLRNAPLAGSLCACPDDVGEIRVAFAGTARLDRFAGTGWLATGDAAIAFDPLSSQGILKALHSGIRAAETVTESLQGNGHAQAKYSEQYEVDFEVYEKQYFHYYAQERRWPDQVFWKRRSMGNWTKTPLRIANSDGRDCPP
jgi:flavin-dependent dehydrogenase